LRRDERAMRFYNLVWSAWRISCDGRTEQVTPWLERSLAPRCGSRRFESRLVRYRRRGLTTRRCSCGGPGCGRTIWRKIRLRQPKVSPNIETFRPASCWPWRETVWSCRRRNVGSTWWIASGPTWKRSAQGPGCNAAR
jgi:hypothetical protein